MVEFAREKFDTKGYICNPEEGWAHRGEYIINVILTAIRSWRKVHEGGRFC